MKNNPFKIKKSLKNFILRQKEEVILNWKYERKTIILIILFSITFIFFLVSVFEIINMIWYLAYYNVHIWNFLGIVFNIFFSVFPFALWITSTTEEFFYFFKRKRRLFFFSIINAAIILLKYLTLLFSYLIVPALMSIQTDEAITPSMIIWTGRFVLSILFAFWTFIFYMNVKNIIQNEEIMQKVIKFKISDAVDMREDKDYCYDQMVIRDSETGEKIPFYYKDRFMHQFFLGSSGTGKTSAGLLKMIWDDLKQKYTNRKQRWKCYKDMLKKKEAYLLPDKDGNIDPENIVAFPEYEEKLNEIKIKYPDCGYTCIGPDEDLSENVIKYCKLFGFKYMLCDPTVSNGEYKDNFRGMNPYHIPDGLAYEDWLIEVASIASMIADDLQAVFEESGATDVYFSGVNKTCTVHVSRILMAAMPYSDERREPLLTDLSKVLYDFTRIEKYVKIVKERYGSDEDSPFFTDIDYAEKSMLGKRDPKLAEKVYMEANGLRNILDQLLQLPNIKKAMCSENPIDFKENLDRGGITLINYGLKYGKHVARGFGLLFIMSFHNEIKKRDFMDPTLIPHFEVVDEFSLLIHSLWEEGITLLRKYKVASTFAFQSMSQFAKNDYTQYMGKVVQGVGQMIVFGRIDAEGAKIFSEIAGKKNVEVIQKTITQTSLLSDNPTYSMSERSNPTQENYIDASDLRNTSFLEAHVYPVKNGTVYPPVLGKLYFVTDKEKNSVKLEIQNSEQYDWDEYVSDIGLFINDKPVDDGKLEIKGTVVGEFEYKEENLENTSTENDIKNESNPWGRDPLGEKFGF